MIASAETRETNHTDPRPQRIGNRRKIRVPGRLTWRDASGTLRFVSVVTRDVSDVDAFVDYPFGPGVVTAQAAYQRIDGDTTFRTLPEQDVILLELGYLFRQLKLTPVLQFTSRAIADTNVGDETRWSVGLNYWWAGHNANVKAAWGRIDPRVLPEQNQFTVQLQLFYY